MIVEHVYPEVCVCVCVFVSVSVCVCACVCMYVCNLRGKNVVSRNCNLKKKKSNF